MVANQRGESITRTGSPVYAGFWIRLGAELIDSALVAVAAGIMATVVSLAPTDWLSVLFIPVIIYGVYKHLKCQTLGRRILGLTVVNQAGEEVSFWRGTLRETIGKFVSAIFFFLGYIWVAFDRDKQGWHDKIAGTYVVRRKWRPRPVKADSI
jgi:uncharacterized RDD family membrane protein YckC